MNVIVDTSVWSMVLRRRIQNEAAADALYNLNESKLIVMLGPIRQEILSGLNDRDQLRKLERKLREFDDYLLVTQHFEYAAELANQCMWKGIQGSATDFLICAVSKMHDFEIFTFDKDFELFQPIIGLKLYRPPT